ncbi:MAG: hypothetical protein LBT40_13960 [Deltaproteobacteria bacterium]|jgi:replicative DNA helicase|nr:hypothetical protein [Deltaproteobacteria bacterium]
MSDKHLSENYSSAYFELDLKTEKVLLGNLIGGNELDLDDFAGMGVGPGDFLLDAHREICFALMDMYSRGQPVDIRSLSDELSDRGAYESAGGRRYLEELKEAAAFHTDVRSYAMMVADSSAKRRIMLKFGKNLDAVADVPESGDRLLKDRLLNDGLLKDVEEMVKGMQDRLSRGKRLSLPDRVMAVPDTLKRLRESLGSPFDLPAGFRELDRLIGGIQKSELIVLGGLSETGADALAMNIAVSAAIPRFREDHRDMPACSVLYFSTERSRSQTLLRIICQMARLDFRKIVSDGASSRERQLLDQAMRQLRSASFHVADISGERVTPREIEATAAAIARDIDIRGLPPLRLIVVDCLQLMPSTTCEDNGPAGDREGSTDDDEDGCAANDREGSTGGEGDEEGCAAADREGLTDDDEDGSVSAGDLEGLTDDDEDGSVSAGDREGLTDDDEECCAANDREVSTGGDEEGGGTASDLEDWKDELLASLKSIAKTMQLAVLCSLRLDELSWDVAGLPDFADLCIIENYADVVGLVHRNDDTCAGSSELENMAELRIIKNRLGPVGVVHLQFMEHCFSFIPQFFSDMEIG